MSIGVDTGSVGVILDFSDNIWYAGILGDTLDQGLSLTSVALADGTPLARAGLQFDFIPESTIMTAYASAADDLGLIEVLYDTVLGTENRAAVFPFSGTATAKLRGGHNRGGIPTEAMVNLDVNPEPNPLVYDLAGASVGGVENVVLRPVPEPSSVVLFALGILAAAVRLYSPSQRNSLVRTS
jgi:hypothetical protein